jgi:hypothetical protein
VVAKAHRQLAEAYDAAPEQAAVRAREGDEFLPEERLTLELGGRAQELEVRIFDDGVIPPPEPVRHVRYAHHLSADVGEAENGLFPEDEAVVVPHPKDADATWVLERESANRAQRAARVLVVVVDEEEVRAAGARDRRLARQVPVVAMIVAVDNHFVARLELLDDALERCEQRFPPACRDDHGKGDATHGPILAR